MGVPFALNASENQGTAMEASGVQPDFRSCTVISETKGNLLLVEKAPSERRKGHDMIVPFYLSCISKEKEKRIFCEFFRDQKYMVTMTDCGITHILSAL